MSRTVSLVPAAVVALGSLALAACGSPPSPLSPTDISTADRAPAPVAAPMLLAAKGSRAAEAAIVIERGELDLTSSGGTLRLEGTRGFSLTAGVARTGGIAYAFEACVISTCAEGAPISLAAAWSGVDLPATVTLDSATYASVGSVSETTTADVQFAGSLAAPPLSRRLSQTATAAFTLSGRFLRSDADGVVTAESFSGGGTARVWLTRAGEDAGWSVQRVLYQVKRRFE